MPMPKPGKDEEQDAFMSRCMSDLKDEFPDQDQRTAVCMRQWGGDSKKKKLEDLSVIFKGDKKKGKFRRAYMKADAKVRDEKDYGLQSAIGRGYLYIPHNQ